MSTELEGRLRSVLTRYHACQRRLERWRQHPVGPEGRHELQRDYLAFSREARMLLAEYGRPYFLEGWRWALDVDGVPFRQRAQDIRPVRARGGGAA